MSYENSIFKPLKGKWEKKERKWSQQVYVPEVVCIYIQIDKSKTCLVDEEIYNQLYNKNQRLRT